MWQNLSLVYWKFVPRRLLQGTDYELIILSNTMAKHSEIACGIYSRTMETTGVWHIHASAPLPAKAWFGSSSPSSNADKYKMYTEEYGTGKQNLDPHLYCDFDIYICARTPLEKYKTDNVPVLIE